MIRPSIDYYFRSLLIIDIFRILGWKYEKEDADLLTIHKLETGNFPSCRCFGATFFWWAVRPGLVHGKRRAYAGQEKGNNLRVSESTCPRITYIMQEILMQFILHYFTKNFYNSVISLPYDFSWRLLVDIYLISLTYVSVCRWIGTCCSTWSHDHYCDMVSQKSLAIWGHSAAWRIESLEQDMWCLLLAILVFSCRLHWNSSILIAGGNYFLKRQQKEPYGSWFELVAQWFSW